MIARGLGHWAWRYFPVVVALLVWEGFTRVGIFRYGLVPSLGDIARSWIDLLLSLELLTNGATSLVRVGAGFALAVIAGVALGVLMARVLVADDLVKPVLTVLYPIPQPALIPILILWLGTGEVSKIVMIFLGALLPVVIASYNGARGVDQYVVWSAQNMGTRGARLLWKVIVPAALPEILAGVRTALALSFLLLLAAELLAARSGLGFLTFYLGEGGFYPGMFAAALTIALLGFVADRGYLQIMRRVLHWR